MILGTVAPRSRKNSFTLKNLEAASGDKFYCKGSVQSNVKAL